jgi:hypothetical protein
MISQHIEKVSTVWKTTSQHAKKSRSQSRLVSTVETPKLRINSFLFLFFRHFKLQHVRHPDGWRRHLRIQRKHDGKPLQSVDAARSILSVFQVKLNKHNFIRLLGNIITVGVPLNGITVKGIIWLMGFNWPRSIKS